MFLGGLVFIRMVFRDKIYMGELGGRKGGGERELKEEEKIREMWRKKYGRRGEEKKYKIEI